MSDSDEPEYEVEYIISAKVGKSGRKKEWMYYVKWKGYEKEDNTWEPKESFKGSEHIIDQFWSGVTLREGKDKDDMSHFSIGEEVIKTGPPRGSKKKKKSKPAKVRTPSPVSSEVEVVEEVIPSTSTGNKRRRTSDVPERKRLPKRTKVEKKVTKTATFKTKTPSTPLPPPTSSPVASTARSSTRRKKTEEIIPDSESELTPPPPSIQASKEADVLMGDPEGSDDEGNTERKQDLVAAIDRAFDSRLPVTPTPPPPPASSGRQTRANAIASTSAIPRKSPSREDKDAVAPAKAHHPKPRIKMLDDSSSLVVPAGKSHILGKQSTGPQKQGPKKHMSGADSSRLVGTKGGLTSVKPSKQPLFRRTSAADKEADADSANEVAEDLFGDDIVIEPPPPPKTVQELLKEAGVTPDDDLEDFNEDDPNGQPWSGPQPTPLFAPRPSTTILPSGPASPTPPKPKSAFSRPSIFGPLGSASDIRARQTLDPSPDMSITFNLQLDSLPTTSSIPISLKNICVGIVGPSLKTIFSKSGSGPPGRFYRKETCLTLLGAFRTGGSSAIVEPVEKDHATRFDNFQTRLDEGEMFVQTWGGETFVFCSSSNTNVLTQLNLPNGVAVGPNARQVVISRVEISNVSAYMQVIESVV